MRIGFVGLGWLGQQALQAALEKPGVTIAGLYDPDPVAVGRARERAPEAVSCCGLREMLSWDLQTMVIASPSAPHAEQVRRCLHAGIPVFCFKPLGLDPAEVDELVEISRDRDVALAVDCGYRDIETVSRFIELVRRGQLGSLRQLDAVYHKALSPGQGWCQRRELSGGGALMDLGADLLDLVFTMVDPGPLRDLQCQMLRHGQRVNCYEVEDQVRGKLVLGSGLVVNFACSWGHHAHGSLFELAATGTAGRARLGNQDSFHQRADDSVTAPFSDLRRPCGLASFLDSVAKSPGYDARIERHQWVAHLIDDLYKRSGRMALAS